MKIVNITYNLKKVYLLNKTNQKNQPSTNIIGISQKFKPGIAENLSSKMTSQVATLKV